MANNSIAAEDKPRSTKTGRWGESPLCSATTRTCRDRLSIPQPCGIGPTAKHWARSRRLGSQMLTPRAETMRARRRLWPSVLIPRPRQWYD